MPNIKDKATAAANKAFSKKFRDDLEEMVDLEVRASIEEIANEAVDVAVRNLDEDAPLIQTLREDVTNPLAKESSESGIRTVDEALIKSIEEDCFTKSF